MQTPMELGEAFPVRKSKKQKRAFRESVAEYAKELGYPCAVEKGSFGCANVVMGDPEKADFLVTAHYDTCAGMLFPNFITPCNFVIYFGYQLFMVLFMMGLPLIPAGMVWLLTRRGDLTYYIWYGLFWVMLALMIVGPANRSNRNDNTSGVVTVLEIMRTLPKIHRDKVCFVLFDLEEAGLIGSAAYRKAHKQASQNQLILNLDCVGDGDNLMMFPTKKLKQDAARMEQLKSICADLGEKKLSLREKGFSIYPSDQKNFPFGVGICALHRGRLGMYLARIHTRRDTVLEETNVNILRAAITTLITRKE